VSWGRFDCIERRTPGVEAQDLGTTASFRVFNSGRLSLTSATMTPDPTPSSDTRRLLLEAAGLLDDRRTSLLDFAEEPPIGSWHTELTADQWLHRLALMGLEEAELRRVLNMVSPHLGLPRGARERILRYLELRVGETVQREELAGVAGIDDWARRVRELRVESGYRIASNETRDDLKLGEYVLEASEPDLALRDQWRTANGIRRSGGSGRARLLAFFHASVGRVVTKEQLRYVSGIQEHPRRVRELTEVGWQIDSHLDSAGLHPGEYLMINTEQLDAKARQHIKRRHELLARAEYRCTICGADPRSDGVRLQIHHRLPVHAGGANTDDNLVVLCDGCHAGAHAVDRSIVVDELRFPQTETTYS
jgi:hypothetical protein